MRRLKRLLHEQRGASALLVALCLIPLFGVAAIAIDVGALYADKANLQNSADAAALQVATACAKSETSSACTSANASAIASSNDPVHGAVVSSIALDTATNVVTVGVHTGGTGVAHPFASILSGGNGTATVVTASGSAEWGAPIAGPSIALAIGVCEFENHPPQSGVANPTQIEVLYNTGTRQNCGPFQDAPGGFGWLSSGNCSATIDPSNPWLSGSSGNSTPGSGCSAAYLSTLLGSTIFVPVYDNFSGTGNNTQFHILQFAAFVLTGFKVSGGSEVVLPGTTRLITNGNDRGLQGYFTNYVSVSDVYKLGDPGSGYQFGASVVRLTLRTG